MLGRVTYERMGAGWLGFVWAAQTRTLFDPTWRPKGPRVKDFIAANTTGHLKGLPNMGSRYSG